MLVGQWSPSIIFQYFLIKSDLLFAIVLAYLIIN